MRYLELCPVTIGEARTFVERHHRHHHAPQSGLFAVAVADSTHPTHVIVGVAVVGRPIARAYQDGYTAEVTRCCVLDGFKNACSMLYGAAWRAARALGYRRIITYTLAATCPDCGAAVPPAKNGFSICPRCDATVIPAGESGSSLRGAGWKVIATRDPRSWAEDSKARPRVDRTAPAQRLLWEVSA